MTNKMDFVVDPLFLLQNSRFGIHVKEVRKEAGIGPIGLMVRYFDAKHV